MLSVLSAKQSIISKLNNRFVPCQKSSLRCVFGGKPIIIFQKRNRKPIIYILMQLETILSVFSILVNIVGFYFVIRQITQQALATRGETYTSLCGLSYEILKMISDHPYLYDYFYKNKKLAPDSDHKVQVWMCCEMIANYCDNVTLQRENIPEAVWVRWKNFIKGQLDISTELKSFMLEYKNWYSAEMIQILEDVQNAQVQIISK